MDEDIINSNPVEYRGYFLELRNPYGFWFIKSKVRGQVPNLFKGKFTTMSEAKKAIDAYVNAIEMKTAEKVSNSVKVQA